MLRKKTLIWAVIGAIFLLGYYGCGNKNADNESGKQVVSEKNAAENAKQKEILKPDKDYSDAINMAEWYYDADDKVYYQLGILYTRHPADEKYEKLAIFVPEAFLNCEAGDAKTYKCKPNKESRVGNYSAETAPIVIPIETTEYNANPSLTKYRSVKAYTDAGYVYVHIGFRGMKDGAPAGLTDIKAAIRYIRHNRVNIPAHPDRIFVFGVGRGGGLAALVGTTADSTMFRPYLKDIGALEYANDKIYGVMAWSPLTNFDTANEAYEWNMGISRSNLSAEQKKMSQAMAQEYARYVNSAGFRDKYGKPLMLQYSNHGVYQEGGYYDYIKSLIEDALNEFLRRKVFPLQIAENSLPEFMKDFSGYFSDREKYLLRLTEKLSWLKYDEKNNRYVVRNVEDFVRLFKPATKPVGAFDAENRKQPENILFGNGKGKGYHFDKYIPKILKNSNMAKEYGGDLKKQDAMGYSVQDRLNMYTPLYFILPIYEGYRTAKVAPFWRIRSGISQTETALTTEANLALALVNYPLVEKVDFKTVWGQGYGMAEESGENGETVFIKWVDEVLKSGYRFDINK